MCTRVDVFVRASVLRHCCLTDCECMARASKHVRACALCAVCCYFLVGSGGLR